MRLAQQDDLEGMFHLDALIVGNTSRRDLIAQTVVQQFAYVAEQQHLLAGFLLLHQHFFGHPFVELLIVHPTVRRQGTGMQLLQGIEPRYTPGKVFTSTNHSNHPMQQLLSKAQYLRSGIIEHLDEGDPELIFVKILT